MLVKYEGQEKELEKWLQVRKDIKADSKKRLMVNSIIIQDWGAMSLLEASSILCEMKF